MLCRIPIRCPEVLLASVNAFLCHNMGIGTAQARRTGAAMYIDHHLILCSSSVKIFYSCHGLFGIVFPKIDLDALNAPTSPHFERSIHILIAKIFAIYQPGVTPEKTVNASLICILYKTRKPGRAPSGINKVIGPAHFDWQITVCLFSIF